MNELVDRVVPLEAESGCSAIADEKEEGGLHLFCRVSGARSG
jgi:hypothetical protein